MPSRFKHASPPSLPISIAVAGDTTPSIAAAIIGSSNLYASTSHVMSTSSGSRVRRLGTIAMSSNPYARRPDFPIPISTSTVPPALSFDPLSSSLGISQDIHPSRRTCDAPGGASRRVPGGQSLAPVQNPILSVWSVPSAQCRSMFACEKTPCGLSQPGHDPRVHHPERLAHELAVERVARRLLHVRVGRVRDADRALGERDAEVRVAVPVVVRARRSPAGGSRLNDPYISPTTRDVGAVPS